MSISVSLPDELAQQVRLHEENLPAILNLGLREWHARGEPGFTGLTSVLETLASLPAPAEVLAMRPSPSVQARIDELLEKNRQASLSGAERCEWEQYQFVEHLVRLAKARAWGKLQQAQQP